MIWLNKLLNFILMDGQPILLIEIKEELD